MDENASGQTHKSGRKLIYWLIGAVAVAALGAGGFFAYQGLTARQAADSELDRAITLVERADSVVLDVDEIVRAEIDTELGERAEDERGEIPGAVEDLEAAIELIDNALEDLADDRYAEARALRESAEARLAMLEPADTILEANVKAARALVPATDGWDQILEGESIADDAVAEYNKLTKESVTESKKLSEQAEAKITDGKAKLEEAVEAFPEADLAAFVEYATTKLANLEISQKANEAFLDGKNSDANKLSSEYNDAENKLVEQAKGLPASPAAAIAEAYESVAGTATTDYFEARQMATDADADLNSLSGQ